MFDYQTIPYTQLSRYQKDGWNLVGEWADYMKRRSYRRGEHKMLIIRRINQRPVEPSSMVCPVLNKPCIDDRCEASWCRRSEHYP